MLIESIFIQLIYLNSEVREQRFFVAVEDYNWITQAKVKGNIVCCTEQVQYSQFGDGGLGIRKCEARI